MASFKFLVCIHSYKGNFCFASEQIDKHLVYLFPHDQVSNYLIIDIRFIWIHYSVWKTRYEKCKINEENKDETLICKEVGPKKLWVFKVGYVECLKGIYCQLNNNMQIKIYINFLLKFCYVKIK